MPKKRLSDMTNLLATRGIRQRPVLPFRTRRPSGRITGVCLSASLIELHRLARPDRLCAMRQGRQRLASSITAPRRGAPACSALVVIGELALVVALEQPDHAATALLADLAASGQRRAGRPECASRQTTDTNLQVCRGFAAAGWRA
ncbi:hypothetical protein SA6_12200 [Staphylococcus epidermidis]|nr:hypothetical protein SA6_12200 [Staphylococcus epidermidis]